MFSHIRLLRIVLVIIVAILAFGDIAVAQPSAVNASGPLHFAFNKKTKAAVASLGQLTNYGNTASNRLALIVLMKKKAYDGGAINGSPAMFIHLGSLAPRSSRTADGMTGRVRLPKKQGKYTISFVLLEDTGNGTSWYVLGYRNFPKKFIVK